MSHYKDLIRGSGTYSIAVIAARAASFLLVPVYTRYLTPTDYGMLELMDLTSTIFGMLVGMRLGDSLLCYYSEASSEDARHRTVSTVFLSAFLLGCVAFAAGWLTSPFLSRVVFGGPRYSPYFRLTLLTAALSLPIEAGLAYMRAANKAKGYTLVCSCRVGLAVVFNVTFLTTGGMGVWGILWGSALSTSLTAAYVAVHCLVRSGISFDRRLFVRLVRYGAPLALSSLGMFVIHFGDRFFLQRSVSLAELGIYSLAYKIGMLISYVQMPFSMYWFSQMFKIVLGSEGDRIFARTCTYLTTGLTLVGVCIVIFAPLIVKIAVGPTFQGCVVFVPWIVAAYVIRGITEQLRSALFVHKRTGTDSRVVSAGVITCLIGYASLIPTLRVWGAVIATLGGFLVMCVVALIEVRRLGRYRLELRRMLHACACAGVTVGCFWLVRPGEYWSQVVVGALFAMTYPLGLWLTGFLNVEENRAILVAVGRVRQRVAEAVMGG